MIQTHRCRHCGQVLEAVVEFAPGIPLALSQQGVQAQVESAKVRHADQCAGRQKRPERPAATEKAKPKPILTSRLPLAGLWRRFETH